jgi:hypothetical protein
MEKFLVIVEIEAIEISALAPARLLDPQHLTPPQLQRLAGPGFDRQLLNGFSPRRHDVFPVATR